MVSMAVVAGQADAQITLFWARACRSAGSGGLRLAIVRPSDQELAWLLREEGVTMVWDEFWNVPQIARVIERYWRQLPIPDLSLEEQIWNNLPWQTSDLDTGRRRDA
jgi:hypothetical protein